MSHPVPLLEFDEIAPDLQTMLKPTVERLGYFGELSQALAQFPNGMKAFMQYTGAVKEPLPFNLSEVCALTVCSRMGGDYERIQHERLALKSGMDRAWIGELTGAETPSPSVLDDTETKVRDLARVVVDGNGRGSEAELAAVVAAIGPEQALAVMLQITRFMTISVLVHSLGARLPVPSIFDDASASKAG